MKKIFVSGIVFFLFAAICAGAVFADDYLIINNTRYEVYPAWKFWKNWNNSRTKKANELTCQKKIQDFAAANPNAGIVMIDEAGNMTTLRSGGTDRLVYVKRPLDLRETLRYIDGSGAGLNTNRRDAGRQIARLSMCGSHGDKKQEGVPNPFVGVMNYTNEKGVRTESIGIEGWKKEFTSWERQFAEQGIATQSFFTPNSTADINTCYTARGQFAQYLANNMPAGATVRAGVDKVWAGRFPFTFWTEPRWRCWEWRTFTRGGPTNSELASADEIKYLTGQMEAIRADAADVMSGKRQETDKDAYNKRLQDNLMKLRDLCSRAEPNPVLAKLGLAIWDISQRAGHGELTEEDLETLSLINNSIMSGNPISAELQERAQNGMPAAEGAGLPPEGAVTTASVDELEERFQNAQMHVPQNPSVDALVQRAEKFLGANAQLTALVTVPAVSNAPAAAQVPVMPQTPAAATPVVQQPQPKRSARQYAPGGDFTTPPLGKYPTLDEFVKNQNIPYTYAAIRKRGRDIENACHNTIVKQGGWYAIHRRYPGRYQQEAAEYLKAQEVIKNLHNFDDTTDAYLAWVRKRIDERRQSGQPLGAELEEVLRLDEQTIRRPGTVWKYETRDWKKFN